MGLAFAYFKEIIVAAGLVFATAGVVAAVTAPGSARGEQAAFVSVDRANKGDRLPYASTSQTHVNSSLLTPTPQAPPKRPPVGCDAAFSSVADPTQAHIYKRCAT